MVNFQQLLQSVGNFKTTEPYNYCVIENFLEEECARSVAQEFPDFDSKNYNGNYTNQIELKKTCNIWDRFLPNTYKLLHYLNSPEFVDQMCILTGCDELIADPGLHGGGQHIHPNGGKLNPHLDYSIHPKLGLQRKFNLLIYLTPEWNESWGGDFGIWNKDHTLNTSISPQFNRAIIFDTTQDSLHGLSTQVNCPDNKTRNSIAVYYLTPAPKDADKRNRALFVPTEEQKDDKDILDLIERRSKVSGKNVEEWDRK